MNKKKYLPIFSGDESTAMWKEVCDIQYKEVRIALCGGTFLILEAGK